MSNTLKTTALLAALTVLFILLGNVLGGEQGMVVAFVFAGLMNFASYWWSDKIVLWMYGAREVSEAEAPAFHALVRRLAQRAGLPMPRVYIIPTDTPNAFATGRNPEHAAVAATEGILRLLTTDELEGVMAHELGHVRNRDILISTVAATLAGAIMMLGRMAQWAALFGGARSSDDEEGGGAGGIVGMLVLAILAPLAAMLIQMAISRAREYLADAAGAQISRKPWALADALEKLERASAAIPMNANPATAHMFIVNPLSGGSILNLFSTHPPVEARVARLRAMRIA
ncbi:MAG TPA: zinc metalloprotease HtpX [Candidatus Methylomirabilis sp.]|nr:zinc metalloprotease HtpX [Candidatus Methylomirabilis sp.]HSC71446.1 zinc metalloprotease HtpX [Candidatus Methylomirabilis sp.]